MSVGLLLFVFFPVGLSKTVSLKSEGCNFPKMLKAAPHGSSVHDHVVDPQTRESTEAAGCELRRFLISKHVAGKMPATKVCVISNYVTKFGGVGVSDLALKPAHLPRTAEMLRSA